MNKMPRKTKERKLAADHSVSLAGSHAELQKFHLPKSGSIREIQYRAETVTPVLKEILDYRPSPRW